MKLVVFGDSWTFGSEIRDPKLDFNKIKEWDIENDKYRTRFIWPNILGDMIKADEVINLSWPASSNDGILRTAIDWIMINYISKKMPTNDLFIIIGFTNMNRRDFFYDGYEKSCWQTIWPVVHHDYGNKNINEFVRIYEENFYTPVDDMNRYINQLHYLELFLKKYGINYLFFQSFYENKGEGIENWNDIVYKESLDYEVKDILRWREIDKIRFVDKDKKIHSFHNRIVDMGKKRGISDVFANVIRQHPNEIGHSLWGEYLYEYITNYELLKN